jgi:glycosyltransferase involved in cell wall biosynthesis
VRGSLANRDAGKTGSRALNLLHVLSQRPDSTGSGIYIQAMLREAADRGHRNFLVAGIPHDQPALLDGKADDNCAFVRFGGPDIALPIVGMSDVMPYASARFCDLSSGELQAYEDAFTQRLERVLQRFTPHVIHSHHLWIVSALVRRLAPGIPMVTTCHGSDLRQFQNCPHLRGRVLEGCRRLDAVMALSEAQKENIVQLYGLPAEKIFVVGAGYNDRLFSLEAKPAPDPVQIVYAGKLSNAKGVPWLLRSLSTITDPAWELHLVGGGSGEEQAACLALARQLGDRVRVHGAVTQAALAGIMKTAHLFVLPSFYEGLPLVVLEALASGCRIVATDLPGVVELLGDTAADFVTLVARPRLVNIDQPLAEDEGPFEMRLAGALQSQIEAAARRLDIDRTPVQSKLDAYTWGGVFQKVHGVYEYVLDKLSNSDR